jgi:hypothetical protein
MAAAVKELSDAEVFGAAPRELSDAEVFAKPQTSQLLGVLEGGARALAGYSKLNPLNYITGAPEARVNANVQKMFEAEHAKGVRPGLFGRIVGEVAGTAPTLAMGGPITQGALQGAILSEGTNPLAVAGDAALGGAASKLADVGLNRLKGAAESAARPVVKALTDRGVSLTPGEILGGGVKALEDKATSLPFVGNTIRQARGRSLDTFNRGAVQQVLDPIGVQIPKTVSTGHDAVAFAQDALSEAYDRILPHVKVSPDAQFAADMQALAPEIKMLPAARQEQVQAMIANAFHGIKGSADGPAFKRAESRLGTQIRQYMGSQDGDQRAMAGVLQEVQANMRELLARQNPAVADQLRAVNSGYALLTRVERAAAAGNSNHGVFSPSTLKQAAKTEDRSVRKRVSARGEGLLQQFAEAGKDVLKSLPDSGTAGRMNLLNPVALAAGAAINPLAALIYSPIGQELLGKAATAAGKPLAAGLERMRLPVRAVAPVVVAKH